MDQAFQFKTLAGVLNMQMNLAQQSNNDNSDFLPGEGGQLVHRTDIRPASAAELDAKMRLGGGA